MKSRFYNMILLMGLIFLFIMPANAEEVEFFEFEISSKGDCPFSGKCYGRLDSNNKIDKDKKTSSIFINSVFKERVATAVIESYSEYSEYWDISEDSFGEFIKLMYLSTEYEFQVLPDFVLLKYTCRNPRIYITSIQNWKRVYIAYIESADTIFVLNNSSDISLVESYNKLFDYYGHLKNMSAICRAKILVSMMYKYNWIAFLDSPEDIPLAVSKLVLTFTKDTPIFGEYKYYLYFDNYEPKDSLNNLYNFLQSSESGNRGFFAKVDSIRNATEIFNDVGTFKSRDRDVVKLIAYNPAFDCGDMIKWKVDFSNSGHVLSIGKITEPVYLFMLYPMSADSMRLLTPEAEQW